MLQSDIYTNPHNKASADIFYTFGCQLKRDLRKEWLAARRAYKAKTRNARAIRHTASLVPRVPPYPTLWQFRHTRSGRISNGEGDDHAC